MTLIEYMRKHGLNGPQELASLLPSHFSRQQIATYLAEVSVPDLENAIIIFLALDGQVDFTDLLPDNRRKNIPAGKSLRFVEWESDIILKP